MPVKHKTQLSSILCQLYQGQAWAQWERLRKHGKKPEAQKDEEASSSSGAWSDPFFGWLVRVIPKPTKNKIRTARTILLEQYPNVLSVESLPMGVCLTLAARRNKHAVSKNIHSLLDSVFREYSMEITPTDSDIAPLTRAFRQHFDQDVRLIQVGPDGSPFYFHGAVLHVNTDHKDVASLLELDGTDQSCAIHYFSLGIKAVGASVPGLPPLPTQSVANLGDVTTVAPLSEPGLRIAGGDIAEMVETQSLSDVVRSAGGSSQATVQNQEDAVCQLRPQASNDSHRAVDHHHGSNSPEGTTDHDRFGDGEVPTRTTKRDGRRDDTKKMLLQLKRPHFEAIKSERKRWEARPLVQRRKDGSLAPWKYRHLATEGRVVKFQCGPPPNLVMRVVEVRLFVPNGRSSIPPEHAMVQELGSDLLPDATEANARVQVYRRIYGADVCAHGFVAMRLKRAVSPRAKAVASKYTIELPGADAPPVHPVAAKVVASESQTSVRRPRTCASPHRCGNIGCDDCYPPGGFVQNKRKGVESKTHLKKRSLPTAPKRAAMKRLCGSHEAAAMKRLCGAIANTTDGRVGKHMRHGAFDEAEALRQDFVTYKKSFGRGAVV